MIPLSDFPALNASLNGLTAVLLTLGYVFIRRQNKDAHRLCMISALVTSSVFLGCYLYYHFHHLATRFNHPGPIRYVYYVMLFTHVVLAVGVLPFIFTAVYQAFRGNFEKHKKITRWVWPVWMYVSVTGVLVYFMLYRWFAA